MASNLSKFSANLFPLNVSSMQPTINFQSILVKTVIKPLVVLCHRWYCLYFWYYWCAGIFGTSGTTGTVCTSGTAGSW